MLAAQSREGETLINALLPFQWMILLSSNIQCCFDRTKQGSRFRRQPDRALLGHLGLDNIKTDGRNDGFDMI